MWLYEEVGELYRPVLAVETDVGGTYMSTKGGMTYVPDLKCVRD